MKSIVERLRAAGCVFAEDEARVLLSEANSPNDLNAMLEQRTSGIPLEHVLGWAEFCGVRVHVAPGVFVPRPRSALLVRVATELVRLHGQRAVVVDLCCGSGAVGAAISASFDNIEVHAVDLDAAAVQCARRNLPRGHVHEGNLYDPLPSELAGRVDVLVANAPYVPTGEVDLLPPEARLYEPIIALDGGNDGLDVQRDIVAGASRWLTSGGHLLIETGAHQASKSVEIFAGSGFSTSIMRDEELGATVVIGSVTPTTSRRAQSSS